MKGIVVGRGKCLLAKYSDHTSKKNNNITADPPLLKFFCHVTVTKHIFWPYYLLRAL